MERAIRICAAGLTRRSTQGFEPTGSYKIDSGKRPPPRALSNYLHFESCIAVLAVKLRKVSTHDIEKFVIAFDGIRVSAMFLRSPSAKICFVLAHGAGAGMEHPSMTSIATGLAARRVATLRFQFPYMENGKRRPDPPPLCHATVRAAVAQAARLAPKLPLIAGGRSFGGRMTSQAQAIDSLPGVKGLAFLGFPLHPAGKPATDRADHLRDVKIPMLFLQGTRDELASLELLKPVIKRLGTRATLKLLQDADHSFHVPARTGRQDADVRADMLDALAAWAEEISSKAGPKLSPKPRSRSKSK